METQKEFIGKQLVTANLNFKLWKLAKENFIKFNVSLEQGVIMKLIEAGVLDISDLPTNSNYFTKEIARLKKDKAELISQLNEFKDIKENGESS